MISQELLSEVLSPEICTDISDTRNEVLKSWLWLSGEEAKHNINIYELAHKCKEWALRESKKYELLSYIANDGKGKCEVYESWHNNTAYGEFEYEATADTESEAIFKACQWILEKKD